MRRLRRRDDSGATAVLVAIVSVVLFGAAALAVDYSALAMERQQLHDNIDAAAHAGAFELPVDGTEAVNQATALAKTLDPSLTPDVDMFCVVASKGSPPSARTDQIPATCDPGAIAGTRCNSKICIIPCVPAEGDRCNAVRVADVKAVPYGFAKIIGFDTGSTGTVTSLACKGSCGMESPNPLDVVFMADRTRSMVDADREAMKTAIVNSLATMTPSMHHVAFGTLHKSQSSPGTCKTDATTSSDSATAGKWVALDYSDDYLTSGATPAVDYSDPLVKGIACLPASPAWGTNLAAAFKGAARYLINQPSATRPGGAAKKVLIFETDGVPDETIPQTSYFGLDSATDFSAGSNGSCSGGFYSSGPQKYWCSSWNPGGNGLKGCQNLQKIAEEAKARDITVITVGFGQAATGGCTITNKYSSAMPEPRPQFPTAGEPVRKYLAAAASNHPVTGAPTVAGDCTTASGRAAENTDGDYFFCAVSGSEMADIFKTAVVQVSTSIRMLQIPS